MMMRVCMCVRVRVNTGACEYVVLLFLLLLFFTLEGHIVNYIGICNILLMMYVLVCLTV